ncbi:MAG: hypothetical protein LiPW39_273 [Parcubacteria group bacterium LiPW_39]|nr:MAG: hypothetical protein LiPW39_273 [Parcubacteria group bacterium LiPW_39]
MIKEQPPQNELPLAKTAEEKLAGPFDVDRLLQEKLKKHPEKDPLALRRRPWDKNKERPTESRASGRAPISDEDKNVLLEEGQRPTTPYLPAKESLRRWRELQKKLEK